MFILSLILVFVFNIPFAMIWAFLNLLVGFLENCYNGSFKFKFPFKNKGVIDMKKGKWFVVKGLSGAFGLLLYQ